MPKGTFNLITHMSRGDQQAQWKKVDIRRLVYTRDQDPTLPVSFLGIPMADNVIVTTPPHEAEATELEIYGDKTIITFTKWTDETHK